MGGQRWTFKRICERVLAGCESLILGIGNRGIALTNHEQNWRDLVAGSAWFEPVPLVLGPSGPRFGLASNRLPRRDPIPGIERFCTEPCYRDSRFSFSDKSSASGSMDLGLGRRPAENQYEAGGQGYRQTLRP